MLHSKALQAFIAVAEELHFGNAARRLHMSQPPLSQQIRRFEEDVGTPLFVRNTRSVSLTPAGVVLLKKAKQLVSDGQAALVATQRRAAGNSGHLTIGFTSTAAYQLLPKLLAGYHACLPDITFTLKEDLSANLITLLADDRIDLALLRRPAAVSHEALVFTCVSREAMYVAMPHEHPYAQLESIAPQLLHGIPFIGFSADSALYFRERIQSIFTHFQIQPHIVHESVMPTLLSLVEAGMGLALVPESASSLRPVGLRFLPLNDDNKNVAAIDLYCAQRRDDDNPALNAAAAILGRVD
ncbi:LysR family transcriptional regulator [Candidimonas sp. SYP-B2681]|uniref:LysR family transcriptional regulator n=1 Tax=Candidimonas sp. SYP-B2681 TaxID=2497686 RepID=UPI000F883ED0|nr:LysR substrate-binding domain-containing protein [Candidimonas sp. SYP-B2681]RTZ47625.1 LysR family transcriptional regulator [Candidimonas sp. SYP-B2681]